MCARISKAQTNLLRGGLQQIGLAIPDGAMLKLEKHLALIDKWRSRINLISISDERELITHHALDSLVIAPLLTSSKHILDIGTGAGFPGLPLASVFGEKNFTLLDSRQRRIEFLRLVITQIGFSNVTLVATRIEDFPELKQRAAESARIDTIVVRAVAPLAQLLSWTKQLRCPGQRLIAMKGVYPREELEHVHEQHADAIENISVERLSVPYLVAERHAVIVQF